MAAADERGGTTAGLVRALGSVLGVHIEYAQREAKSDIGRVVVGVVLIVAAALFAMFALLFGQVVLAYRLSNLPALGAMGAIGVVAAGDLALAIVLLLIGRSRLDKPVLAQTRSLVKRTVESFADV